MILLKINNKMLHFLSTGTTTKDGSFSRCLIQKNSKMFNIYGYSILVIVFFIFVPCISLNECVSVSASYRVGM